MGTVLALLLISTVSAMTLAGPRVLQVVGEDFPLFRSAWRNQHGWSAGPGGLCAIGVSHGFYSHRLL